MKKETMKITVLAVVILTLWCTAASALTADEAKAHVEKGVDHFNKAYKLDEDDANRKTELKSALGEFKKAFADDGVLEEALGKADELAAKAGAGAERGLLFYLYALALESKGHADHARKYIEKALSEDDREAYREKKKSLE
jgi:tetratricopeptide (TPR) repeat protein